jgi:hypothetical protein
MSDNDAGLGVWLYAVGTDLDGPWLNDVRGVDGESVRLVSAAGLGALVGTVSLDRFGAEALRRNLNDLDQLGSIARAHHAVIRVVGANRAAAPARLATVYADDAGVRRLLTQHGEEFISAIRRIRGRQEWGVKAYAAAPAPATPGPDRPPSGAAYLRQRRDALHAAQASRTDVADAARSVHLGLADIAASARVHRPQDRNLSGDPRPMVLNGAYLVDETNGERFAAAVTELANTFANLDLVLTGPWPPYSFAVVDDENAFRGDRS